MPRGQTRPETDSTARSARSGLALPLSAGFVAALLALAGFASLGGATEPAAPAADSASEGTGDGATAPDAPDDGAEGPLEEALDELTEDAATESFLIEGVVVDAVPGEAMPAEPPDPMDHDGVARYRGEELYYSLRLFGSEMARGALVLGDYEAIDGVWTLPAYGLALTEGVAAMIYPMRDEATSTIDPTTGLPLRSTKDLRERDHYRNYDVVYEQSDFVGRVTRLREEQRSRYQRALPGNTYDALSWVYALRDQPLEPGTTFVYYMYDGWKLSRITATVRNGTESVLVGDEYVECREIALYRQVMLSERPLPFIQETASLPPVMWEQETRQGEQVGNVWISNDHRRLPVKIEFQNELVSAVAQLSSFRPPTAGY